MIKKYLINRFYNMEKNFKVIIHKINFNIDIIYAKNSKYKQID